MAAAKHMITIGPGQLGRLFSGGALRLGMTVIPATRATGVAPALAQSAAGNPILVTVGEAALMEVLASLPSDRRKDVILVQNELLPAELAELGVEPTYAVVWTSVKPGQPIQVGARTGLFGEHAGLMARIHETLDLPFTLLQSASALKGELSAKYALILTINALGMAEDLRLDQWLERDPDLVRAVVEDAMTLGGRLLGDGEVDGDVDLVVSALQNLGPIRARGRSAPARVERASQDAARLALALPAIDRLNPAGWVQ
ncbi:MAG: hypothetical protein KC561_02960 [Myxococcales bacterium]|nr:hypothetical protein [Myxococcales bacterium]